MRYAKYTKSQLIELVQIAEDLNRKCMRECQRLRREYVELAVRYEAHRQISRRSFREEIMKILGFRIGKSKPDPERHKAYLYNIAAAYVAIERLAALIAEGKGDQAQGIFQDLWMDLEDWMILANIPPHLQWVFQVIHEYFSHSGDWERAKACILKMTADDARDRKEFEEFTNQLRGKVKAAVEITNAQVPVG